MSEDLKRRVMEALERTDIMALSTIGTDGPWTAPVQYRYNEKLDLFFLSMPGTRHVRDILNDPRVSAAIYSHPGPPGSHQAGVPHPPGDLQQLVQRLATSGQQHRGLVDVQRDPVPRTPQRPAHRGRRRDRLGRPWFRVQQISHPCTVSRFRGVRSNLSTFFVPN